jgi:hypothetical protein
MTAVVCLAYLPNIHYCSWIIAQKQPYFVRDTHYHKQTYRNRTEIYGANGKLKLTLPIVHNKSKSHQKEEEVQIVKTTAWQKQHWKSICSAYRSSPYFEFYEADLISLYKEEVTHLMQFNLDLLNKIMELIEFSMSYKIVEWKKDTHRRMDDLVNAKKSVQINFEPYRQVFEEKNGFIPNLSIIDLLFNLGPDTLNYLQKHSLKI